MQICNGILVSTVYKVALLTLYKAEKERTKSSETDEKALQDKFDSEKAELIANHQQLVSGMESSLSQLERLNSEKDQSIKELHLEMTSLRTEVDLLVSFHRR